MFSLIDEMAKNTKILNIMLSLSRYLSVITTMIRNSLEWFIPTLPTMGGGGKYVNTKTWLFDSHF